MQALIHFEYTSDYERSIEKYSRLIDVDPNYDPMAYLNIAEAHIYMENYASAEPYLKEFLTKDVKEVLHKHAEVLQASCSFAVEAKKNPVPFDIKRLGPEVNTPFLSISQP